MRKPITLQLSRQEAKLLIIWAVQDQKKSYASRACKTFDDCLINQLKKNFNE